MTETTLALSESDLPKQALGARANGGEVAHALRGVWGTYVPDDAF